MLLGIFKVAASHNGCSSRSDWQNFSWYRWTLIEYEIIIYQEFFFVNLYFFLILRIGFIEYNQIWQTFHDKTVNLTLFLNVATIHLKMVDIRDFESCSEICQYNLFKEYGCLAWLWSQWLKSISKGDYSVTRLDWHLGH